MFNRKTQNNNQPLTLFKGKNSYSKVIKEMNEPPKEYEAIKALLEESNNNSITNNIKTKNNIQMKSHNKSKK